MPIYGYECTNCGSKVEVFQKMSDPPLTTCEACEGALRKRVFPVGIVFKGSGFYVNDYANNSNANIASDRHSTPAATESTSHAPSDGKAESNSTSPSTATEAAASKKPSPASGAAGSAPRPASATA